MTDRLVTNMTLTEWILARNTGADKVVGGDVICVKPDLVFANDVSMPLALIEFQKLGARNVFDPQKVAIICDHFVPSNSIKIANQIQVLRSFASDQGIRHFYEPGRGMDFGIEHALLPELGLINPFDVVVGGDSHAISLGALGAFAAGFGSTDIAAALAIGEIWLTVPQTIMIKYIGQFRDWVGAKDLIMSTISKLGVAGGLSCALEISGHVIETMSMDERLTLCNMCIEAGAKNAIIAPDDITLSYLNAEGDYWQDSVQNAPNPSYLRFVEIDVSKLQPQVAVPPSPANVLPVSSCEGIKLDAVFIGSCTNGRIEDLRTAARILKGRRASKDIRFIIIPATQSIFSRAVSEGLVDIFINAGALLGPPSCGPCFGGHLGLVGRDEKILSTTNRNFPGRMGHPTSEIYLASPAVAAASAIKGYIAHPRDVIQE